MCHSLPVSLIMWADNVPTTQSVCERLRCENVLRRSGCELRRNNHALPPGAIDDTNKMAGKTYFYPIQSHNPGAQDRSPLPRVLVAKNSERRSTLCSKVMRLNRLKIIFVGQKFILQDGIAPGASSWPHLCALTHAFRSRFAASASPITRARIATPAEDVNRG